jgi:hypothetical protein
MEIPDEVFSCASLLSLSLSMTAVAKPQELSRNLEIEVIRTTYDIRRTETLVYLRVFSDGSAEGHPTANVDFRTLVLKPSQVPPNDLAKFRGRPQAVEHESMNGIGETKISEISG